ncbi:substrate-binding domain-containing protein [Alicyclobacillus fastidiosus]|uniref:Substrate-binding domain-containing protein n=1 Tax=Alicyclobacillus fastidiosus TaxID=392011 RepID=A0ABV5AJU2_9BACL|nr:substrate-binding domain-containing protein [Alicyclobacillus fastidiosus]WEH08286.1 substrate-binding domain-containing protein [Alicyclobacillus fastidiosus]
MFENHVRELRRRSHMSQAQLASAVHVSRQTIQSIESGSVIPSTLISLRLARVLGVRVEDIFREQSEVPAKVACLGDEELQAGDRVIVAQIDGKHVAHRAAFALGQHIPTAPLANIVSRRLDEEQVELTHFGRDEMMAWTIVCGCDPSLGLLATHASNAHVSSPVYWMNADNGKAARLLNRGAIQVAAIHRPSSSQNATQTYESISDACYRIHVASWELGWVVKRGNPCGFSDAFDLADGKIRIVNRPVGAGARTLLDERLSACGVMPDAVSQYSWTVAGHTQVAMAVDAGVADVGIAIAGVASAMHLDFIPIQQEQCELWIPKRHFPQSGVQRLLDSLSSDVFRWDLARFGPYDTERTGSFGETPHSG